MHLFIFSRFHVIYSPTLSLLLFKHLVLACWITFFMHMVSKHCVVHSVLDPISSLFTQVQPHFQPFWEIWGKKILSLLLLLLFFLSFHTRVLFICILLACNVKRIMYILYMCVYNFITVLLSSPFSTKSKQCVLVLLILSLRFFRARC